MTLASATSKNSVSLANDIDLRDRHQTSQSQNSREGHTAILRLVMPSDPPVAVDKLTSTPRSPASGPSGWDVIGASDLGVLDSPSE